jgi:hypothetical protein
MDVLKIKIGEDTEQRLANLKGVDRICGISEQCIISHVRLTYINSNQGPKLTDTKINQWGSPKTKLKWATLAWWKVYNTTMDGRQWMKILITKTNKI